MHPSNFMVYPHAVNRVSEINITSCAVSQLPTHPHTVICETHNSEQIILIWNGLDFEFQRDIDEPIAGLTMNSFLQALDRREAPMVGLSLEEMKKMCITSEHLIDSV